VAEIGLIGKNILRRGRTPRLSDAVVVDSDDESDPSVEGTPIASSDTVSSPPKKTKNHEDHEFNTACIVVWRDADKLSFREIRQKLEDQRGWVLSEEEVIEEHGRARAGVWGVTNLIRQQEDEWEMEGGGGAVEVNDTAMVDGNSDIDAEGNVEEAT
jgi:hypothetical protein